MDGTAVVTATLAALASGFAAFIGSYMKKKGEGLATKEDFSDLVRQTRDLTDATKSIEATISQNVWSTQRHWELKRDLLLSALEPVGRIDNILMKLSVSIKDAGKVEHIGVESVQQRKIDAANRWLEQMDLLDERRRLLFLVCSRHLCDVFFDASQELRKCAQLIMKQSLDDDADLSVRVRHAREAAYSVARLELGLASIDASLANAAPAI